MEPTIFQAQELRSTTLKRRFACGSMVRAVLSVRPERTRFFRSQSEKNEKQKEDKVPLRTSKSGPPRNSRQANIDEQAPKQWRPTEQLLPNIPRWNGLAARLAALIGLGLIGVLLYARGITAHYPLAIGLRSPRAGWSTLAGNSLAIGIAVAGVYAMLVVVYILALRLVLRLRGSYTRLTIVISVVGWLLSSAALLGAYPGESFDIFDYVFRGRMIVEYGASPLAVAPFLFADRPFYQYITWRGQVDTYGPLWEYASGAVAWVVEYVFGLSNSHVAYIVGYRLMAMLLVGLCGLLIGLIVRRASPEHTSAALLAWLWNPLLIITSAIGAHNDLLMVLMMVLAFWLFQRRAWVWGLLALILAGHVKLTALLILPIVGLWLLRQRGLLGALRDGAVALVLAVPLSWLLYAPFGGWDTLRRMLQERARLLINSPADLVYRVLQERYGWSETAAWRVTTTAATIVFLAGAALVLAWFWWHTRRRMGADSPEPDEALLWGGCVMLTLVYLLIGSFWFQHWYLLWLLAPAALLPASRWTLTLLPVYCLGALCSNLSNSFLRYLPGQPFSVTQVSAINVLAQVAPLLFVMVVTLLSTLRATANHTKLARTLSTTTRFSTDRADSKRI